MASLSLPSALVSVSHFDHSYLKCHLIPMLGLSPMSQTVSCCSLLPRAPVLRRVHLAVAEVDAEATSPVAEQTVDSSLPPKKVLVPIGQGTEEMEAVILVHVLRQAGADVTIASVEPQLEVEGSARLKLVADTSINSCADKTYDLIALPGGMPGAARLRDCDILCQLTSKQAKEKRLYGAISTAPAVTLLPWGLIKNKRITGHPSFMRELPKFWAAKATIQVSGELTTSSGPGTAYEFALSLVEQLFSESVAQEVRNSLLMSSTSHPGKEEFNPVEWSSKSLPRVLLPVANGSDEIEAVTIVDILRRARVNVVIASVERTLRISASQGTIFLADKLLKEAAESSYDMIVLPGGHDGAKKLSKSKILKKLLKEHDAAGRICGIICSSPEVLQNQGLLKDKRITAHPCISDQATSKVIEGAKVVIDGNLITSKGLSSSTEFALAIVRKFLGHTRAKDVAQALVFDYRDN